MRLVTENTIENQTPTDREEHRRNDRDDPMHGGELARPAEPEERDGEGEASDAGWGQLSFRCDVPVLVKVFGLVFPFPPEVAGDGDGAGGDKDAEEGEAAFAGVEAVDFAEDYREGFEPDVEDAVDEGDVEVHD